MTDQNEFAPDQNELQANGDVEMLENNDNVQVNEDVVMVDANLASNAEVLSELAGVVAEAN